MYLGGSCYTGIYDYIKDLEIAVIAMDSFRRMTHGTPWPKQHVLAKKNLNSRPQYLELSPALCSSTTSLGH